jgi:hypothetical protein
MSDLRAQLNKNTFDLMAGNVCLSKAGLAEGTDAATIKTAAPNGAGTDYAIGGALYHKADTDNIALTAADTQADGTTCYYNILINAAGTVSSVKGDDDGDVPVNEDTDLTVIGIMKIVLDGGTFTAGTTDLSGTGVTATFTDTLFIPRSNP